MYHILSVLVINNKVSIKMWCKYEADFQRFGKTKHAFVYRYLKFIRYKQERGVIITTTEEERAWWERSAVAFQFLIQYGIYVGLVFQFEEHCRLLISPHEPWVVLVRCCCHIGWIRHKFSDTAAFTPPSSVKFLYISRCFSN